MPADFSQTKAKTLKLFRSIIKPRLNAIFPNRDIHSVEYENSQTAKMLDEYAGIDLLLCDKQNNSLVGVAVRIQIADESYDTFTVRLRRDNATPTEYEKRSLAIREQLLFPQGTLQAYISPNNELLSMAIVKTVDLFNFIDNNWHDPSKIMKKHTKPDQIGQASFVVCKWETMTRAGIHLWRYPNPP